MPFRRLLPALLVSALSLTGCVAESGEEQAPLPVTLGPVDGRELPGTDLERVVAGTSAPDFALASLAGPTVALSEFRGSRNVILVFYRGWW